MKVNKVYRDFHLSKDEYYKHRNNLASSHYVVKSESWSCRVLYFDGDDGVALFKNPCEGFDDDGVQMELIDCSYCDISLECMSEISETFNKFKREREDN